MEPGDLIWEGTIGSIPLRVGVPYAGRIIAEWDTPAGSRHKVADSLEEFERAVIFQLLLKAGETGETDATKDVIAAVKKAEAERPRRAPAAESRRRKPRARQHRRSRRPPRRR